MKSKKRILVLSIIVMGLLLLQSAAIVGAWGPPGGRSKYYVNGDVIDSITEDDISGATVKCYVDELYKGQATTTTSGHFSFSVLLPIAPRNWMVKVIKAGYVTKYVGKPATNPTTSMGVIELTPSAPPINEYTIYGHTHEWFSSLCDEDLEGVTVEVYREVYEGWQSVGTTLSLSTGAFSFPYSSPDVITSFKVIATKSGFSSGSSVVTGTGTDFDMGDMYLAGDFYDVYGTVTDDLTLEQVPSSSISVYSTFSGSEHYLGEALTDEFDGNFDFLFACSRTVDSIRIVVSKNGYISSEETLTDPTQECNFGEVYLGNIPVGYAVIVGITSYENTAGYDPAVEWSSNDALLWYNYLLSSSDPTRLQYYEETIWLLGDDEVTGSEWDDIATEVNVELALNEMVESADANDVICFIASAHGDMNWDEEQTGIPSVAIKLFDFDDIGANTDGQIDNEVVGVLWDFELTGILESTTEERIFVFLDVCSSGGFIDDFEALQDDDIANDVYDRTLLITGTSDYLGSTRGYPSSVRDTEDLFPDYGVWTYVFVQMALTEKYQSSAETILQDAYLWANEELDDLDDEDDDTERTRYQEEFYDVHVFFRDLGIPYDADLTPSDSDTPSWSIGYLMEIFCLFRLI